MKVTFVAATEPKKFYVCEVLYGDCCTVKGRPGEVFMRLKTTHNKVRIHKTDAEDYGTNLIKLFNFATNEIECWQPTTECDPVAVELRVVKGA